MESWAMEPRFFALVLCLSAQSRIKEDFKRAVAIERKIGALQKRQARTARFYMLKHNADGSKSPRTYGSTS